MDAAPDVRRWAPDVPDDVAALVARALETEPDDRFQSAREMLKAVRALGPTAPVDPRLARRRARTRMVVAGILAMLAGAVVTLLAVALVGR
jgi:hypothetical protein